MKRLILLLIPVVIVGTACEGVLDPRSNSDITTDKVWSHATYGEGTLGQSYANIDWGMGVNYSVFTDDAVPATEGTNELALGSWTVEGNPIGQWATYYNSIKNINIFLENAYDLRYEVAALQQDSLLRSHRIGEAYFLRAWFQWELLQKYAGPSDSGEMLGFPIVTTVLEKEDNPNLERDIYEDGVAQIAADLDSAITRLPLQYNGGGDIYGPSNRGRGSALAAMALKARVYLYAASPAYGPSTQQLWERAALAASEAIDASGGLTNLSGFGNFNNFNNFNDNIWIQPTLTSNFWEQQYYPPSLFGQGTVNPSQNLVDVFPASDGYPIDQSSKYDPDHPYDQRDPRFERFIFHNGEQYNGKYIRTYQGGDDAPGGLSQQGTRTGYYLQKHTSFNVDLSPNQNTQDTKFKVMLGREELYLNFAEAANEAFGPSNASMGYTAADALRRVRQRAGIDSDLNTSGYQDQYLTDQANAGQSSFRELVRNERRIELSFEGHRFWDLRRWNMPLTHTVTGWTIVASDGGQGQRRNVAIGSDPSTDYVSPWASLDAINDGTEPTSSGDQPSYGNWNSSGLWRYVQFDFPSYMTLNGTENTFRVDSTAIYWFNDGGGILPPDSISIQYQNNSGAWVEIANATPSNYELTSNAIDQWNVITFDPVETAGIRLNMKSNSQSTGLIEWQVWGSSANQLDNTFTLENVETHTFQDYMRYVPIPYSETLIMSNLQQNKGW